MNMEAMIDKYFRPGRLPHIWCPGCGNGVVTGKARPCAEWTVLKSK